MSTIYSMGALSTHTHAHTHIPHTHTHTHTHTRLHMYICIYRYGEGHFQRQQFTRWARRCFVQVLGLGFKGVRIKNNNKNNNKKKKVYLCTYGEGHVDVLYRCGGGGLRVYALVFFFCVHMVRGMSTSCIGVGVGV